MKDLFIKGLRLIRNDINDFEEYPFNIPAISNMSEIKFEKPVTFIVGANGSGKSTILEAIAVSMGLSAEGGTRNMVYETFDSTSKLHNFMTIIKSGRLPKWKYFLRAESFYTMANAYENYRQPWEDSIHEKSHGEAFSSLLDGLSDNGLYIMDEPESALSPQNQMLFLSKIHFLVKSGSQFIIVTHSPILLSYYDATILNADDFLKPIKFKETEIYNIYKHFLECPEKMQKYLFEE